MKIISSFNSQTFFCLMGPTASGKTNLAMELVKKFPFEIISVDSAMVYRGMDIGTAKPTAAECHIAPHRLINICDPSEPYSAGQFRQDALREIQNIFERDRWPLLVGGTMLYFHVLQNGLADLPSANQKIRDVISKQAQEKGWEFMHNQLQQLDPKAAAKIHPNDSQRISRALEVCMTEGKSFSEVIKEKNFSQLPYQFINLAIAPSSRSILHDYIAARFQRMMQQGFLEEVTKLFQRGDLNSDLPSMRTVGYRQFWDYLSGNSNYEDACERSIIATRQLAKRQLTWLRSWKNLEWFDSVDNDILNKIVNRIGSNLVHKKNE